MSFFLNSRTIPDPEVVWGVLDQRDLIVGGEKLPDLPQLIENRWE